MRMLRTPQSWNCAGAQTRPWRRSVKFHVHHVCSATEFMRFEVIIPSHRSCNFHYSICRHILPLPQPYGYSEHVLLPVLRRHLGLQLDMECLKHGFFPKVISSFSQSYCELLWSSKIWSGRMSWLPCSGQCGDVRTLIAMASLAAQLSMVTWRPTG